jgi:hypothetical protein
MRKKWKLMIVNLHITVDTPKNYSVVVANKVGICDIAINSDSLQFNFILSETGETFDTFTILKLNGYMFSDIFNKILLAIVVLLTILATIYIFKRLKRRQESHYSFRAYSDDGL